MEGRRKRELYSSLALKRIRLHCPFSRVEARSSADRVEALMLTPEQDDEHLNSLPGTPKPLQPKHLSLKTP